MPAKNTRNAWMFKGKNKNGGDGGGMGGAGMGGQRSNNFSHQQDEWFIWSAALQSVLKNNSIHGPSLILGADNIFMAIFYTLLTLVFLAYCTFQIVSTILTFLSYEIITTTEVRKEAPSPFPVVAFCNINQFDQVYAGPDIRRILATAPNIEPSSYTTTAEYENALEDYYRLNFLNENLNNTAALGLGYSWVLNQMLVSCHFQDQLCTQEDFIFIYDFYYSSCFRFNQGKMKNGTTVPIKNIGKTGWRHGLQLELYAGLEIDQEEYVPSRGFHFAIFNQSNPYQILDETGINVATGMLTNIAIKRTYINHLPAPYGNCLSNDISKVDWNQTEALKFMYTNFIEENEVYYTGHFNWPWTLTYSQKLCVKLCYQEYLWESCNCYDVTLPKSQGVVDVYAVEACVNITDIDCMSQAQTRFYKDKSLFEPCYQQCPIECNEIKFEYKTSTASYPTPYYAEMLVNNEAFNDIINAWFDNANKTEINYTDNYDKVMRAVAKVNVFYEDLRFTIIQEEPAMTLETFVCYLGGLFGMFMGGSFLSLAIVMEMTYYLSLCLFRVYHARQSMQNTKRLVKYTVAQAKWDKSMNSSESNLQQTTDVEDSRRALGPSISPPVSSVANSRSSTPQSVGLDRVSTDGRVRSAVSSEVDIFNVNDKNSSEQEEASDTISSVDSFAELVNRSQDSSRDKPRRLSELSSVNESTRPTTTKRSNSPRIIVERVPSGRVRTGGDYSSTIKVETESIAVKSVDEKNKTTETRRSMLDDLTSFAVFEKKVAPTATNNNKKSRLRLTPMEAAQKRYSKAEPLWPGFKQN